jgi:hypothetical protein
MEWRLTRLGLLLLAIGQGFPGVWALVAPRSFYDDFPGGGSSWVSPFPPYNEHLIRDYGSALLALAVLAVAAAVFAERRLAQVALAVLALSALPHVIYHAAHASRSGAGTLISLGLGAALPVLLLFLVPKESS